jgi:hypothetical protein
MDFADSPEHAAFRAEFRHWLEANLPPEICVDDADVRRLRIFGQRDKLKADRSKGA